MILEATLRLFKRDRELHTAATISKEAKIAKGTLYLYFKTKEEIYGALGEQFSPMARDTQKLPSRLETNS